MSSEGVVSVTPHNDGVERVGVGTLNPIEKLHTLGDEYLEGDITLRSALNYSLPPVSRKTLNRLSPETTKWYLEFLPVQSQSRSQADILQAVNEIAAYALENRVPYGEIITKTALSRPITPTTYDQVRENFMNMVNNDFYEFAYSPKIMKHNAQEITRYAQETSDVDEFPQHNISTLGGSKLSAYIVPMHMDASGKMFKGYKKDQTLQDFNLVLDMTVHRTNF